MINSVSAEGQERRHQRRERRFLLRLQDGIDTARSERVEHTGCYPDMELLSVAVSLVAPLGLDGIAIYRRPRVASFARSTVLGHYRRNDGVSFEYKPLLREIIVGMFHTVSLKTTGPTAAIY